MCTLGYREKNDRLSEVDNACLNSGVSVSEKVNEYTEIRQKFD